MYDDNVIGCTLCPSLSFLEACAEHPPTTEPLSEIAKTPAVAWWPRHRLWHRLLTWCRSDAIPCSLLVEVLSLTSWPLSVAYGAFRQIVPTHRHPSRHNQRALRSVDAIHDCNKWDWNAYDAACSWPISLIKLVHPFELGHWSGVPLWWKLSWLSLAFSSLYSTAFPVYYPKSLIFMITSALLFWGL